MRAARRALRRLAFRWTGRVWEPASSVGSRRQRNAYEATTFQRSIKPQRSITRPLSQARIDSANENRDPGTSFDEDPTIGTKTWLAGTETISESKGGEARHLDIASRAAAAL